MAGKTENKPLNAKQEAFVDAFLETGKYAEAARKSGYHTKYAQDILSKQPHVRAAIRNRQSEAAEKAGVTASWVLIRLKEISDRCMGYEEGERFEPHGATKATELVGRHLGMFVDRKEVTGADGGAIEVASRVQGLPTQELEALLSTLDDLAPEPEEEEEEA